MGHCLSILTRQCIVTDIRVVVTIDIFCVRLHLINYVVAVCNVDKSLRSVVATKGVEIQSNNVGFEVDDTFLIISIVSRIIRARHTQLVCKAWPQINSWLHVTRAPTITSGC